MFVSLMWHRWHASDKGRTELQRLAVKALHRYTLRRRTPPWLATSGATAGLPARRINIPVSAINATHSRFWLAAGLCLVALNLRGPMTAIGPVLPNIMRSTGLHASGAGVITTIPVLCLGLLAPFAPALLRRCGPERSLLVLMGLVAAGALLRWPGTPWALMVSGVLIGGGIGMSNVLLPSLVKRDFPNQAAFMIGLYTMMLCISAAVGQAISVPLAGLAGGWPQSLAWWTLPAVLAAVVMGVQDRTARRGGPPMLVPDAPAAGLWRDGLAWQITIFMGLQSCFTYIIFSWLPPLLQDRGLDPVTAGLVTSASSLTQMFASLAAPLIAVRLRDQRLGGAVTFGLGLAGFLGCRYLPLDFVWWSTIVMGLGQGSMFGIAVILLVLRSPTPAVTAQLSSMAQTIGYLVAAAGPMLIGVAHNWMGNWAMVTPVMVGISVAGTLCGALAGRARVIDRMVAASPVAS